MIYRGGKTWQLVHLYPSCMREITVARMRNIAFLNVGRP